MNDIMMPAPVMKASRYVGSRAIRTAPIRGPMTMPMCRATRVMLYASARRFIGTRSAIIALLAVRKSAQPKAASSETAMAICHSTPANARVR